MSTKSTTLPKREIHWEPKFPFDLVVGYTDLLTRNRALMLYDRLAQQLLDEYDFRCAWWKFDLLHERSLMVRAVDDAIAANMIILSLHGSEGLPPIAKLWIETWATQKVPSKSALVALIDMAEQPNAGPCHVQGYLQQIARRAGMDVFFHATDLGKDTHVYTMQNLLQRAQTVTPVLEEILHRKDAVPRIVLS